MKRGSLNFIINLVSLADMLCLTFSGYVMWYVLPPGSGGLGRQLHNGRGREQIKSLWAMTRHDWSTLHFYLSVLFVMLIAAHLILHWNWIKSYLRSLLGPEDGVRS
jgi:uncharacterized iron-regulated membrane protein